MTLEELMAAFGEATPDEITTACNRSCSSIEDYAQAERYLWAIIRKLYETGRIRAASRLLMVLGWVAQWNELDIYP
jgi:hypothetical protein